MSSDQQARGFWNHPVEGLTTSADHLHPLTAGELIEIVRMRTDRLPTLVWFTRTPGDKFDPDLSPEEPSHFWVSSRAVRLVVSQQIPHADQVDTTELPARWIMALLERLGRRFDLRLLECGFDEQGWGFIEATYHVPKSYSLSRTLQLADLGQRAISRSEDTLDGEVIYALLRADVPEVLVSLHERSDLEVKRSPYLLTERMGGLELAKDVSSIANGGGGVLAIGFATKGDAGGDLISSVTPCQVDLIQPVRYRRAIRRAIYPVPGGLEVTQIAVERGRGCLIIYVPPQPDVMKPFMVRGARSRSGDRIEGNHIGIFRRVVDEAVPVTVEEVHGLLRGKGQFF